MYRPNLGQDPYAETEMRTYTKCVLEKSRKRKRSEMSTLFESGKWISCSKCISFSSSIRMGTNLPFLIKCDY